MSGEAAGAARSPRADDRANGAGLVSLLRQGAADLRMYASFAWGLRGFLRTRITLDQARATIRRRLEERETRFLRLVERGVYGHPRSPYLPLLRAAGCELGDLRELVRRRGLADALRELRRAGVYVTFEEFKGRAPISRPGCELDVSARDFDNPFLRRHYVSESGGSTGARNRIPHDLDHLASTTPHQLVTADAHGVLGAPLGQWSAVLPSGFGLHTVLRGALMENVPQKWFVPVTDLKPARRFRLAHAYIVRVSRLLGVPVPELEPVPLERAGVIARWAAGAARRHGASVLRTSVSLGLRVAVAATREGIDLSGVTIWAGGEPTTAAKVAAVKRSGARWIPGYGSTETGPVGLGCANPVDGGDLHFCADVIALIQHPQRVPRSDLFVDAFCFTSLDPAAPKLLLNVELDDYGVVERRPCGCPLEELGFVDHIREVRSYRKLTGEGVTLIGSDMERILEEILPARFGGTPLDYQLMEEEDSDGFTRLSVIVSPSVGELDEDGVVTAVLEALGRESDARDVARSVWATAGTLRVRRQDPVLTSRLKLLSLRSARHAAGPLSDGAVHQRSGAAAR